MFLLLWTLINCYTCYSHATSTISKTESSRLEGHEPPQTARDSTRERYIDGGF